MHKNIPGNIRKGIGSYNSKQIKYVIGGNKSLKVSRRKLSHGKKSDAIMNKKKLLEIVE